MSRETDEIKSKIDIADFIGGYIKLFPAGANFKALCPFHNEKTPSLMINREKQVWRCFGCGEGGDIFEFLMKMEGLEFPEALKTLARRAGVVLKDNHPQETSQKARLYDICDLAARYWQKVLTDSSQAATARSYTVKRGLSAASLEEFKIGYAIESWDNLVSFLIKRGFKEAEIIAAGLAVKKDRGAGCYDRFRDRLMFPILDLSGRVAGFGGRALKDGEPAKYLNTSQTLIYNKSQILYGLYQARTAIKEQDACILVEGYMDVIPSHQAGIKNVISISGTALTEDQIKIIKRYTNNLLLSLDMDEAGQRAAERSIELAMNEEMNVKVITLSGAKDPGECVQNNPDDWRQAIARARPLMEYYFDKVLAKYPVSDPAGKKMAGKILLEKIVKFGNVLERDHWLKVLAAKLDVSEGIIRELAGKIIRPQSAKQSAAVSLPKNAVSRDQILLKRLLAVSFIFPGFLAKLANSLKEEYFGDQLAQGFYKSLVMFYNKYINNITAATVDKSDEFDLFDLLNDWFKQNNLAIGDKTVNFLTESFLLSEKDFGDYDRKMAEEEIDLTIKMVRDGWLQRRIDQLKSHMEAAERENNIAEIEKIYTELGELLREKNKN